MSRWSSPRASENQEAITLVEWIKTQSDLRDYFIKITNEGTSSVIRGVQMKRLGLKKGVSDYLLALPSGIYYGLWIELKTIDKFTISKEQKEFIQLMRTVGYAADVCKGAAKAIDMIMKYRMGIFNPSIVMS